MSGNSLVGDGEKKKLEARCRSLAFEFLKTTKLTIWKEQGGNGIWPVSGLTFIEARLCK
jgi:hypothetical protein